MHESTRRKIELAALLAAAGERPAAIAAVLSITPKRIRDLLRTPYGRECFAKAIAELTRKIIDYRAASLSAHGAFDGFEFLAEIRQDALEKRNTL